MQLIKMAPADVTALAGSCREFAVEALERAAQEGKVISLQARRESSGLKLIFALSVLPEYVEQSKSDGAMYWQPSDYLEYLRGNDHDNRGKKAI